MERHWSSYCLGIILHHEVTFLMNFYVFHRKSLIMQINDIHTVNSNTSLIRAIKLLITQM